MGLYLILILVIISFIFNIIKKNEIKINLIMLVIPIILTVICIIFSHKNVSNRENIINIINLISSITALILAIISILYVIKECKTIRKTKSILLIGIVMSYLFLLVLSKPTYLHIDAIYDYYRKLHMINISIELLFALEINLFINLVSNNKKEEKIENN